MDQRHRTGLPNSFLHVMNRGARKVSIYSSDDDRRIFVGTLREAARKHEVSILAWCLMPNHYHLEIEANGAALVGMMRDLDGTYARVYNRRHQTQGCLFQGPFRSTMIRDPRGLAYVSRYIHTNPVDLGESPELYPWSSCRSYLGSGPIPDWLDPEPVLAWVNEPDKSDEESYRDYLRAAPPRRKKPLSIFDDYYCEWIRHLEERCLERIENHPSYNGKLSAGPLVCWLALHGYRLPARSVADYFGYSDANSVRVTAARIQKRLRGDPDLRMMLGNVNVPAAQVH